MVLTCTTVESEGRTMKKFSAVILCVLLVVVLFIAPAYAARPPKVGTNAITVTVTIDGDPTDTTPFSVTLSLDGKVIATESIVQGSPFTFSNLLAGTYTLAEKQISSRSPSAATIS